MDRDLTDGMGKLGKPWFMQVNFTGPHPPMDITRHMDEICRHRDFPQFGHTQQARPK